MPATPWVPRRVATSTSGAPRSSATRTAGSSRDGIRSTSSPCISRWGGCRVPLRRPRDAARAGALFNLEQLTRTTTALLEARRFFARSAAVVIHSFSDGREGFSEFQQFVKLMGGVILGPDRLIQ